MVGADGTAIIPLLMQIEPVRRKYASQGCEKAKPKYWRLPVDNDHGMLYAGSKSAALKGAGAYSSLSTGNIEAI